MVWERSGETHRQGRRRAGGPLRGARDAALIATAEPVDGLGARTLALRPSLCRRLRRRLLDPLTHANPLCWRNTTGGIRLFVGAAFSGLGDEGKPAPEDRITSALFCFGAIEASAQLAGFSDFDRRRTELAFLRRAYGLGVMRARWMRRQLRVFSATHRGRNALREGHIALREWLRGIDPSPRLQELVDDPFAGRIVRRRARAPFLYRSHPAHTTAHRGSRVG